MLRSLKELNGYGIQGTDEDIGKVHDFYFDDAAWTVRYLVVDTRRWLPGRRVLIVPPALRQPNWETRMFPVGLSKEQIRKSPSVDEEQPVSRRREEELHAYYGWAPYWNDLGMMPQEAVMVRDSGKDAGGTKASAEAGTLQDEGDPHLRSANEVEGYHIAAIDGDIGHVEDFLVNDEDWTIRYLVVDTRNVLPGKKVLIAPGWIEAVRWSEGKVHLDLSRESIKQSPQYRPLEPVNREYEIRLYDYYGRPFYWK